MLVYKTAKIQKCGIITHDQKEETFTNYGSTNWYYRFGKNVEMSSRAKNAHAYNSSSPFLDIQFPKAIINTQPHSKGYVHENIHDNSAYNWSKSEVT